jgi:hypothetical protein
MKVLHILRSEPDEMTRNFILQSFEAAQNIEISMYGENVDYDQLVQEILSSDQVISWW